MADKIRVTVTYEYTPDMKDYPGCGDVHAAARLDADENDVRLFPEAYDEDIVSVRYEGIPG
ncbi:hypothetical protein [Kitasatospora sp. MBT66]|uniref:hypothetical protein n=1 Tax=Kitasatospora sp. MBT66 TaxID=1444769 RepID=UPI0011EA6CD4|nr:hypothetical protein [Kitasatospora sp. MBT66]